MKDRFARRTLRTVVAVALLAMAQGSSAMLVPGATPGKPTGFGPLGFGPVDFGVLGTAWTLPGPDSARGGVTGANPLPGAATFSMMGAGKTDVSGFDPGHVGATVPFANLLGDPWTTASVAFWVDWALDTWSAVSGFTNLGEVADGGGDAGDPGAAGGVGDIRVAAWNIGDGNVLAHAFQPGNVTIFGPGGYIAGDLHIDTDFVWVDDPNDAATDFDFDLPTVILHEIGHALGLDHSDVVGSIMEPVYAGSRRTLIGDDIAGIQAIYGPPRQAVPEPGALALLGIGLAGMFAARRRRPYA